MEITSELNKIIVKYHLDRQYPRFQKKLSAEMMLKEEFAKQVKNKKSIILLGVHQDDVDYTKRFLPPDSIMKEYCWSNNEILENFEVGESEIIYLVSLRNKEPMVEFLDNRGIIYIDIYDLFAMNRIICEDEYYHLLLDDSYMSVGFGKRSGWKEKLQLEYYYLNKKYERATEESYRLYYAEKMLFMALYMKNFLLAEECVEVLIRYGSKLDIKMAWQEIQELLERIADAIAHRDTKDVIVFWLDAVSYEKSEGMSYLAKVKDNAISFTEAFTITPHTGATLKNIFCQKGLIDDLAYKIEKIDRSNSPMFCYLEEAGYEVKIVSGYWTDLITNFEIKNKPGLFYPSSFVFWDVLENLLEEGMECPKFILAHALIEGHSPYITSSVKRNDDMNQRIIAGKKELDAQLEFYNRFLNPNAIRFFLSDHGQYDFKTRYHIHLDVCSSNLKPEKIDGLFSIMDFFEVLKDIMEEGKVKKEALQREYVPIEDMDWYSNTEIESMFRKKLPLDIFKFGYRGVVTKDVIYAKFTTGVEWSIPRNVRGVFEPQLYPQNQKQVDVSGMARIISEYPEWLKEDKKFAYSAYPRQLLKKYVEQGKKVIAILNEVFGKYPDNSIAIRFGGMHSRVLYTLLSSDTQKKIACFIDNNTNCICADFGKPIKGMNELALMGKRMLEIKAVVLSSFDNLQMLRAEAESYSADLEIIDIYRILENNGICCKENFYEKMGLTDSDYEAVLNPNL